MIIAPTEKPKKSNEWYTPAKYIEAAREVMGGIDLDPASCALANETVKAARYYTVDDDGLQQSWNARSVWLNPPYGRTPEMRGKHQSTIECFVMKLLSECRDGNVAQAIALVTVDVNARWFQWFWDFPICFTNHKIHFDIPYEKRSSYSHMFGTAFAYLGPNEQSFISTFSQFGTVARRVSPTA